MKPTIAELMEAAVRAEEAEAMRLLAGGKPRVHKPWVRKIEQGAAAWRETFAREMPAERALLAEQALQMVLAIVRG